MAAESIGVGSRVTIPATLGYRGEEAIEVSGVVRQIVHCPWGTDAIVDLDPPVRIGNPEWGPASWLSVSYGSLSRA